MTKTIKLIIRLLIIGLLVIPFLIVIPTIAVVMLVTIGTGWAFNEDKPHLSFNLLWEVLKEFYVNLIEDLKWK